MEKNYKYVLPTKEDRQFNKFIDMIIIGTAYNYFNSNKEVKAIEEYKDDIVVDRPVEMGLLDEVNNKELRIAKKMDINPNTVYIIKKRAIKKLEKLINEINKNGRD